MEVASTLRPSPGAQRAAFSGWEKDFWRKVRKSDLPGAH